MINAKAGRDGKIKLIAVVLVAMVIGGAAGGFVVKATLAKTHDAKKEDAGEEQAGEDTRGAEKAGGKASKETAASSGQRHRSGRGYGQIVNLGEFLVNVASADRLRYVKCEIAVQIVGLEEGKKKKKGHGEKEEGPLSEEQMAWVKDAVIRVFADTPFEELKTVKGREKLRARLAAAIEEVLDGPAVRQVLFTSFVMQ